MAILSNLDIAMPGSSGHVCVASECKRLSRDADTLEYLGCSSGCYGTIFGIRTLVDTLGEELPLCLDRLEGSRLF